MIKRAFDLTAASIGLLLLAPVVVACALLIRLGSKGPAIFRQTRVGKDERPFTCYKLRTMLHGDSTCPHASDDVFRRYADRQAPAATEARRATPALQYHQRRDELRWAASLLALASGTHFGPPAAWAGGPDARLDRDFASGRHRHVGSGTIGGKRCALCRRHVLAAGFIADLAGRRRGRPWRPRARLTEPAASLRPVEPWRAHAAVSAPPRARLAQPSPVATNRDVPLFD